MIDSGTYPCPCPPDGEFSSLTKNEMSRAKQERKDKKKAELEKGKIAGANVVANENMAAASVKKKNNSANAAKRMREQVRMATKDGATKRSLKEDKAEKARIKREADRLRHEEDLAKEAAAARENSTKKSSGKKKAKADAGDGPDTGRLWKKIAKYIDNEGDTSEDFLAELFTQYDTDGDGELTIEELTEGFTAAGIKLSRKNFKLMMSELDADGSGSISLNEWTSGAASKLA